MREEKNCFELYIEDMDSSIAVKLSPEQALVLSEYINKSAPQEDNREPVYSTNCMMCDNGKNYFVGEAVPESCPVCGEHKDYDMPILDRTPFIGVRIS